MLKLCWNITATQTNVTDSTQLRLSKSRPARSLLLVRTTGWPVRRLLRRKLRHGIKKQIVIPKKLTLLKMMNSPYENQYIVICFWFWLPKQLWTQLPDLAGCLAGTHNRSIKNKKAWTAKSKKHMTKYWFSYREFFTFGRANFFGSKICFWISWRNFHLSRFYRLFNMKLNFNWLN